jgi:hypothetical protein
MAIRVAYAVQVRKLDYERYRVYLVSGAEATQLCTLADGPSAIEYAQRVHQFLTNENPGAAYERSEDVVWSKGFDMLQELDAKNRKLNKRGD